MRYLMFKLGMPRVGSGNGSWSQQDRIHARVVKLYDKSAKTAEETKELIEKLTGSYHYDFEDGWGASVTVKEVDKDECASITKNSDGFNGYDWMIKSIMKYGTILDDESISESGSFNIIQNIAKSNNINITGISSFVEAKQKYIAEHDTTIANKYVESIMSLLTDRDIEFKTDSQLEQEVANKYLNSFFTNESKSVMMLNIDRYHALAG